MNYTSLTMSHAIKRFGVRWLSNSCIDVSPEVSAALHDGHPVVALESAIITHGMPQPHNLDTAMRVQQIVRDKGAVPATIAILNGRVKVGLTDLQLEQLAIGEKSMAMKTSRRDFPQVIAMKKHGGTTVAGTMLVARSVGIRVFATGGLGGVHRGAEDSWDVSADLVELGRTPVAVVCSGAKAILDIPRTLEFLETQGVCVSTVGPHRDFPAFYWRSSGCLSPCHSSTIEEAAQLTTAWWKVASTSGSGLVLAVPVPEDAAVKSEGMEEAIRAAVAEAEAQNVRGRDLTPFLLTRVNQLTEGTALKTNIALVLNNAATAAQICKHMHEIEVKGTSNANSSTKSVGHKTNTESSEGGVVIVGGCALDRVVKLEKTDIELDGKTWPGRISECAGGVGRNLAEAIGRLQLQHRGDILRPTPLLISAVGRDRAAQFLLERLAQVVDVTGVQQVEGANSAAYEVLLDSRGECRLVVGDVEVHNAITKHWIKKFERNLTKSPLVVLDGNTPTEAMHCVLQMCQEAGVPVWFEPTDPNLADVPIRSTSLWDSISFISPNFKELRIMAAATGATVTAELPTEPEEILEESLRLAHHLAKQGLETVVVTLGGLGVMVVRRGGGEEPLRARGEHQGAPLSARLYSPPALTHKPLNVSGAGDCLAAAMAVGFTRGFPEWCGVTWGMAAAGLSLHSPLAVPSQLQNLEPPHRPILPAAALPLI